MQATNKIKKEETQFLSLLLFSQFIQIRRQKGWAIIEIILWCSSIHCTRFMSEKEDIVINLWHIKNSLKSGMAFDNETWFESYLYSHISTYSFNMKNCQYNESAIITALAQDLLWHFFYFICGLCWNPNIS